MSDPIPQGVQDSKMPHANHLAVDRTWMAHERTLMAWVRTAISMISFGFTVYKFFELETSKLNPAPAYSVLSPRLFSILLISTGIFGLFMALISHHYEMQPMRKYLDAKRSLAQIFGLIIFVLGIFALVAAVRRE
jgi:putative membrane protein